MSESLAKIDRPERNTQIVPVDETLRLSAVLARSALLPPALRGKEADIAVTVMAGRELGLAPMASLRNIHVVQGKPVLSADMMVGVALSSGLASYFKCVESTPKIAIYETQRRGDPSPQRLGFTIEEAREAHLLGKDNWKMYPAAMLRARAKAALARDVYPDVLAGCYIPDEADAFRDDGGRGPRNGSGQAAAPDAIDVEAVPPAVSAPPSTAEAPPPRRSMPPATEDGAEAAATDLIAHLAEAESIEEVRKLAPRFNSLPKGSRARAAAHAAYKERLEFLERREREEAQADHEYAQRDAASDAEVRT